MFLQSHMYETHSVRSEIIALSLEQRSREPFGAVAVKERQGGRESGSWDAPECGLSDDATPSRLSHVDGLVEEVIMTTPFMQRSGG